MLSSVAVPPAAVAPPEAQVAPQTATQSGRASSATDSQTAAAAKVVSIANPSYVLDLGLGLVVLQYHDHNGDVSSTIPSERQLQAYRDGGTPTGEAAHKAP